MGVLNLICFLHHVQYLIMVFKVICLIFHIVDLILSFIDFTRGFIITTCKKLTGNVEESSSGSNSTPAVILYLGVAYYIYLAGGKDQVHFDPKVTIIKGMGMIVKMIVVNPSTINLIGNIFFLQ